MKICLSSTGVTLDAPLDPRFGRAAHLLVFDTESRGLTELHGAAGAAHGAGIQAARAVAGAACSAVITGHIGPNAHEVLEAAGIAIHLVQGGSVADAIERYESGPLSHASEPDRAGHEGLEG